MVGYEHYEFGERASFLRSSVKLGNRVLQKSFKEVIDNDFRDSYRASRVTFGDSRIISGGPDQASQNVKVPAILNNGSNFMSQWDSGGECSSNGEKD
jgi:hypothetical protein